MKAFFKVKVRKVKKKKSKVERVESKDCDYNTWKESALKKNNRREVTTLTLVMAISILMPSNSPCFVAASLFVCFSIRMDDFWLNEVTQQCLFTA